MNSTSARVMAAFGLVLLLTGCGGARRVEGLPLQHGDIVIAKATIPEPPTNLGAAYLVIENRGQQADRFLHAESEAAGVVELHQTRMNGTAMTMVAIEYVELPAGHTFDMDIGSFHLMLIDLKRRLREGDRVPISLTFERAGTFTVSAQVISATGVPSEPAAPHGQHSATR